MDKKDKDILNNLDSSSTGFTIPDGYFDNLENRLYEKALTNEQSDNEKSLSQLHIIRPNELKINRKETGFKVPDNYFEQIESRFDKSGKANKTVRKVRILRLISMSVAASILLFFGIQFMNNGEQNVNQVVIENEEIADWVAEDLITFNTYDIAEAFSDVELEQTLYTDEAVNDYLDFMDIESLILEN
jgi:hypothetical protein